MPENYADSYWTTAPASWVWNGNWKNTHTSTGTELPICDPTNAPTETPTSSPVGDVCTLGAMTAGGIGDRSAELDRKYFKFNDQTAYDDYASAGSQYWHNGLGRTTYVSQTSSWPEGCMNACCANPACQSFMFYKSECILYSVATSAGMDPILGHDSRQGPWGKNIGGPGYSLAFWEMSRKPDDWECEENKMIGMHSCGVSINGDYFGTDGFADLRHDPSASETHANFDGPSVYSFNSKEKCIAQCEQVAECAYINYNPSIARWGHSDQVGYCYMVGVNHPINDACVTMQPVELHGYTMCKKPNTIGAVLKECRWESNHDQNPNSADYMGWTCANDEILTGFGLSADQHDVTKVRCCKVGGHSSIKSNTCTYVESNHERAKCGNGNDHMVFSGAYDKRVAVNDAVTEILAGKCCEVECDAPWCAGGDWGVDKNNCQVISTASTQAQELVCPTGTIMTEVEDGLAGNAHGVQKVASVTCCALDMIAPPTRAPTAPPSTARPTSAPTRAPSTSLPSIAPTTVDDCLLALKDSSQLTDSQYLSNVDLCLPGCRSPRRALESRQLTGRLLSESNSV